MEINEKNIKECDICDSKASVVCYNCKQYFCKACSKFIHEKKKNSNHIKQALDPYIPILLKCPKHPEVPLNLFCLDEKGT